MSIRVVVAESCDSLSACCRRMFDRELDIEVIGNATDALTAMQLAERLLPDVIVFGLPMPESAGLVGIRGISQRCPSVKVLVASLYDSPEMAAAAIDAGAAGFVAKIRLATDLVEAVRAVGEGHVYVSSDSRITP